MQKSDDTSGATDAEVATSGAAAGAAAAVAAGASFGGGSVATALGRVSTPMSLGSDSSQKKWEGTRPWAPKSCATARSASTRKTCSLPSGLNGIGLSPGFGFGVVPVLLVPAAGGCTSMVHAMRVPSPEIETAERRDG